MLKSPVLTAVAMIAALSIPRISTAMKMEGNTGITKFTFPRANGFMILIFDSRQEYNGLALSSSSIIKGLETYSMSPVIEDHKYYALYNSNEPDQLSDIKIQMNDYPISVYVFHPSDEQKIDEKITSLYFSDGKGDPIPVEVIPGDLRIPEEDGFVDKPIVMITLKALNHAGVDCSKIKSATTAQGQNYRVAFDTEIGHPAVPVVSKLFIPIPIE